MTSQHAPQSDDHPNLITRYLPHRITATLTRVTKKQNAKSGLAGLAVLVVLACCGGTAIIGAFSDDKPTTTSGSQQTSRDTLTTIPSPTESTSDGGEEATPVPTRTSVKPTPKKSTAKPQPRKTTAKPRKTTKKPTPAVRSGVRPGAFCSPGGAFGRTSTGKLMVCKSSATDSRRRWRAA